MAGRIKDQATTDTLTDTHKFPTDDESLATGRGISWSDIKANLPNATASVRGLATATQISKLDGISAGAQVNPSDAAIKTAYENNSDTNAYTDAEQTKLSGIADGAQVNTVTSVFGDTGAVTAADGDLDNVAINMQDKVLARANIKDYGTTGTAVGNFGATHTFDLTTGNHFSGTVDQNVTFTFSNPFASGTLSGFTLKMTNGGAFTIAWPASVRWAGGTEPSWTASGVDWVSFMTDDGGTNWDGFPGGLAFA